MKTDQSSWLKEHSLIAYFVLTYVISWTIWSPIVASAQGWATWDVPYALYYFGSFGPAISAFILTALTEGIAGLRDLAGRIFKWRVELHYYAFAVLVPIGLFALAYLLNRVVAGEWSDLSLLGSADYLPPLSPLGVLGLWFLTYGFGEETGWRGFALPHLQRNRSAASATLILALLWACWHLPAFFFRDTYVDLGVLGFPLFAFMMIFTTMVFTWLYNSTRGSVFIVIIFHAVFNWLSVSEAGGQFAPSVMSAPIVLWALHVARRYGQENAALVAKQIA
jgi:membrane protease YdiL (CAAX protease family)